jgi:tetratricopeptide (TPR) repeat protein
MPETPRDDSTDRTAAHVPADTPANPQVKEAGTAANTPRTSVVPVTSGGSAGSTRVAGYTVSGELGRGGMGVVYHARQEGLNRTVALKMIRSDGPVERGELIRFLAEAEAVAAVKHPNVVQVYEYGDRDGYPFLALEFCPGGSLANRLRAARQKAKPGRGPFSPADAAELVRKIAEGVGAAHDQGIVHRDLKPGNVLFDEAGEPKVSDFGLAKRGHIDLTRSDAVMGTPAYMSPEQAKGKSKFVGPPADVWALGVILYECLSGKRPFEADSALAVMRRVAEDPADPIRTTVRDVPRDLDLICHKCLAKEPHERYPTGRELADDLGRFLDGQPVLARSAGPAGRLMKWATRNPGYAALWTCLALALVAGAAVSAAFAARAERAREAEAARAESERQARLDAAASAEAERRAKVAAQEANRLAEARLGQADKAYDVLAGVFRDLYLRAFADERPLAAVLRERVERAAGQLDAASIGDPLTLARMQTDLANVLVELGSPQRAAELAEKALATRRDRLGPDDPDTLASLNMLAMAYQAAERPEPAIPLHQDALARRTAVLGPNHRETIGSMTNLGSAYVQAGRYALAVPLLEEAWKHCKTLRGAEDPITLNILNGLAVAYQKTGNSGRAVVLLEEALAAFRKRYSEDDPLVLTIQSNLAASYQYAGRPDKALPILERTLAGRTKVLGADHQSTLFTRVGLAGALLGIRERERAIRLLEETLPLLETKLEKDHPTTLLALLHLGNAYTMTGRAALAVPLLGRARDAWLARSGAEHPDTLTAAVSLSGAYYEAGDLEKAIPLSEEALAMRVKVLGWDHRSTHDVATNLGYMYGGAGRWADAARVYNDLLIAARRRFPAGDRGLLGLLVFLGDAQLKAGQYAEAERALRECLGIGEEFAPKQWGTSRTKSLLGAALLGQGKVEEAGPLLIEGHAEVVERTARLPAAQRREVLIEVLRPLVRYHRLAGNTDDAKKWQAELEKFLPVAPPPREVGPRG